jgi:hypothetical protein
MMQRPPAIRWSQAASYMLGVFRFLTAAFQAPEAFGKIVKLAADASPLRGKARKAEMK